MTPIPRFLDAEAVMKALDDRMNDLQEQWNICDDAEFCDRTEYARGILSEVFNDIVAGEYDIELPISLANLPPVLLVKDLVRRANEGDPSLSVHHLHEPADSMYYRVATCADPGEKKGEFVGPGVIIGAFGEVV